MVNCVFCKIIKEEIPSNKVYEDDGTLAFMDNTPTSKGHVLVIPKKHSRNIFDISKESFCEMVKTVKKVSIAVRESIGAKGVNVHMNNESAAGQVVFHSHIHVIPRYEDDGLDLWHGKDPDYSLSDLAEKIKSNL